MDSSEFQTVDKVELQQGPVSALFYQLEPATHVAETRSLVSDNVTVAQTRYCCSALILAGLDTDWVNLGLRLNNTPLTSIGREPDRYALHLFSGKAPHVLHAQKHGTTIRLSIKRTALEKAGVEVPKGDQLYLISESTNARLTSEFINLFSIPPANLTHEAINVWRDARKQVKDNPCALQKETQRRYVLSAISYFQQMSQTGKKATIRGAAETACCSKRTLQNAFQRHLGLTPKKVADLIRVNEFRRRVQLRNVNESEEAHAMGFSHIGRLMKEYKALFLISQGP